MLTSFFLFSLYVIVLAVITIVLLFTNLLGKWTVLILIAGWFPIIIWLVSILSLLVQHFGWRTFFLILPFPGIIFFVFLIYKILDYFF
ncbi:MAG: hypothetical protein ABIK99_04420 [candidate division WOR-3 bacterium]